jgi:hypothetical protein
VRPKEKKKVSTTSWRGQRGLSVSSESNNEAFSRGSNREAEGMSLGNEGQLDMDCVFLERVEAKNTRNRSNHLQSRPTSQLNLG